MYTVQTVVNRVSLKPKTFRSRTRAHKFIDRTLSIYDLQVSTIIDSNNMGAEEYICEDNTSRFFIIAE